MYNDFVQISGCCRICLKRLTVGSWGEGIPASVVVGLQSLTGADAVECEPTASGCSSLRFYVRWTIFNPRICDVINDIGHCSAMIMAAAIFPYDNSVHLIWSQEFLPVGLQRRATDTSWKHYPRAYSLREVCFVWWCYCYIVFNLANAFRLAPKSGDRFMYETHEKVQPLRAA